MKINKKLFFITFLFSICLFLCSPPTLSKSAENHYQFAKVQSNLSVNGCPLKLKDGRVLILGVHENYIYYPKRNTFKEIKPVPYGFAYISNGYTFPAVVLNDGNVLIIGNSDNDIYNCLSNL